MIATTKLAVSEILLWDANLTLQQDASEFDKNQNEEGGSAKFQMCNHFNFQVFRHQFQNMQFRSRTQPSGKRLITSVSFVFR